LSRRIEQFLPGKTIELEYKPGWDTSLDLIDVLSQGRDRDIRYGMTLVGPHRADFQVRLDKHLAIEVLSRGQLKMLVCAIKLSMGEFISASYQERHPYQCVYLLDDLAAELDTDNREVVIACLEKAQSQCFFTAVREGDLGPVSELMDRSAKFHVEHGKISA
jgi:DNA replication and repair protein RecF